MLTCAGARSRSSCLSQFAQFRPREPGRSGRCWTSPIIAGSFLARTTCFISGSILTSGTESPSLGPMLSPRLLFLVAASPSVAMSAERRTPIHPRKCGDPSKNFRSPLRHIHSFKLAQKPRRVHCRNCLCRRGRLSPLRLGPKVSIFSQFSKCLLLTHNRKTQSSVPRR